MGYLGLVSRMGLMAFLRPKGERRGMDLHRDESKPAGGAFWADEADGPTASWPSQPPATLAAADVTAPDRRRAGRHAAPRNPGHHSGNGGNGGNSGNSGNGGAGQHARASLASLAFG